jgi:hypothetical protein
MKRLVLPFLIGALAAPGCATSTYLRTQVAPEELVWSADSGSLGVLQGGREVAGAMTWSGLADAVKCVPRAEALARGASSKSITGQVLLWTSVAVLVGAAGSAIAGLVTDQTEVGLIGAGAGLGGGLVLLGIGAPLAMSGTADGFDAVNIYNDEYAATPSCRVDTR